MPTVFRPARPSRRVIGGFKRYLHGSSILTAAGSAAGVATVSGVGVAIKSVVGSTAGAASVSGVGVAIKAITGTAAGVATVSGTGVAIKATVGVSAGVATVTGVKLLNAVISTRIVQKPVDYALAGQQDMPFRKGSARGRALRRAFNE